MKCKIYGWLFRFFPLKKWQAFLIKSHFNQCPDCRKKIETDKNIESVFFSARNFQQQSDLWPEVKREIQHSTREQKPVRSGPKRFPALRWQWVSAALVLIGMTILIPRLLVKENMEIRKSDMAENIIVKSVKFNNRPAKTYFFQTSNPKRLIIWVQKNN